MGKMSPYTHYTVYTGKKKKCHLTLIRQGTLEKKCHLALIRGTLEKMSPYTHDMMEVGTLDNESSYKNNMIEHWAK